MSLRRLLLITLAAPALSQPAMGQTLDLGPEKARALLQKHCAACHAGANPSGKRRLLEPGQLGDIIKPGKPDESELLQLVQCGSEPRGNRPKVPAAEVEVLRDWIKKGSAAFAPVKSDEYALRYILLDQRSRQGTPGDRYFAFNHMLDNPETDPARFAEALTKALNLVTWKSDLVRPVAVDPAGVVFRADLHACGWDENPYGAAPDFNLFDLVLLEYPYATLPKESRTFDAVDQEYVQKAKMVRPVPFVRGDWFLKAAGQSPLYHDLMRLPATLLGLEKKLGVANTERTRAGLTTSGELRIPRRIERGTAGRHIFWRTYDLPSARELNDVLTLTPKDPVDREAVFSLPNALPGFFTARLDDTRTDGPPPKLWNNGDLPRTGFACLRCHNAGVANRMAKLEKEVKADNDRFGEALAKLDARHPARDPVEEVVHRFRAPEAPRDSVPLPALDGLTLPNRNREPPFQVELAVFDAKGGRASVFKPGEGWYFSVSNKGEEEAWIEIVALDRHGFLDVVTTKPRKLAAGDSLTFPPDPKKPFKADEGIGRSFITLFASDRPFEPGVKLTPKDREKLTSKQREGKDYLDNALDFVADRFVHPLVERPVEGKVRIPFTCDPTRMIKQTVDVEIRGK